MANFGEAMKLIRRYEGDGEVNDPKDYGGHTKCGIAKRFHPDIDISKLQWEEPTDGEKEAGAVWALPIYRNDYWNKIGGDFILDQGLAESMMDIAVNIGWSSAVKWAQHAYNELLMTRDPDSPDDILEDGLIGPKTINALNTYRRPWEIVKLLEGFQFSHYMMRIDQDPSQRKFLRSWLSRVEFKRKEV